MPDSMKVAFQVGSLVRDAMATIIRSARSDNRERVLLQALQQLQDAESWVDEVMRVLPRRSRPSKLLARRVAMAGGAS